MLAVDLITTLRIQFVARLANKKKFEALGVPAREAVLADNFVGLLDLVLRCDGTSCKLMNNGD